MDRFFFEPPQVSLALEYLFCSYCAPAPEPRWRSDAHRIRTLARGRLAASQFQDLLRELGLAARAPPDECLRAFRDSASGGAADLSFVEFKLLLARVAVLVFAGDHHTHEDLRDLIRDLSEMLSLRSLDVLVARLEALEQARWRATQDRAAYRGGSPPAASR